MPERRFVKLFLHLLSTYFTCLAVTDNSISDDFFPNTDILDKFLYEFINETFEGEPKDEMYVPEPIHFPPKMKRLQAFGIDNVTERSDVMEMEQFVMNYFCPLGKYCQENKPMDGSALPDQYEPCCKDCSCDDRCGTCTDDKVCCFPSSTEQITSQYRECLSVEFNKEGVGPAPYYYMVSSCPDNNFPSSENSEDVAELCRGSESFLGLVPVFSNRTRLIYRNKYCVQCHGISDVIAYTPYLSCPKNEDDFSSYIIENRLPTNCYLHVKYPGNVVDVQHNRCCPRTFKFSFPAPMRMNLTRRSVISLCEKEPFSPYSSRMDNNIIEQFPNVFCAICNSDNPVFSLIQKCPKFNHFAVHTKAMLSILDMNVLADMTKHEAGIEKRAHQEACRELASGETECRELLCPSVKTYNLAGECQYIVDSWLIQEFHVSLKLFPEKFSALCKLEGFLQTKELKQDLKHTWSDNWHIANIFFQASMGKCSDNDLQESMPYFGVTMKYETGDVPTNRQQLEELTANIQNMIAKDWYFNMTATSIRLKAQFLDFELNNGQPTVYLEENTTSISQHIFQNDKIALQITKLHYCEQIALQDNEYVLYDIDIPYKPTVQVLYLKNSGKVLLPKQFNLHPRVSKGHFVTVCLSDTPFYRGKAFKSTCSRHKYTVVTNALCYF